MKRKINENLLKKLKIFQENTQIYPKEILLLKEEIE